MEQGPGIKKQLVKHLQGGEAFMPVDEMLGKISFEKLGERPAKLPYSFYELFHHIYFTQKDILEYCREEDYTAPQWPEDYWPKNRTPQNLEAWEKLIDSYKTDRQQLTGIIMDAKNDLSDTVPSSTKHTFLREVLLVIEHTAYHSGQMLIVLSHLGLHSS